MDVRTPFQCEFVVLCRSQAVDKTNGRLKVSGDPCMSFYEQRLPLAY